MLCEAFASWDVMNSDSDWMYMKHCSDTHLLMETQSAKHKHTRTSSPAASSLSSPSWAGAIISGGPPGPPQVQMTRGGCSLINDPHAAVSHAALLSLVHI